jgi:hypothetical protein
MLVLRQGRQTERASVVNAAMARLNSNPDVLRLLGTPVKADSGIEGGIRHDETGWREARLVIPVSGPQGQARVHLIAGKGSDAWVFTTFEVVFEKEHEKVDLIFGRVIEYDPNAYVDSHYETAVIPEYDHGFIPAARFDGTFPCVSATVNAGRVSPQFGNCAMPTTHAGTVDRFDGSDSIRTCQSKNFPNASEHLR